MDADPFGMTTRKVAGSYYLEHFESGSYYLRGPGESQGGGVVGGTIDRISTDGDTITVRRTANYGGDKDGWIIIDVSTGKQSSVYSDEEWLKMHPETFEADTPNILWKKL